MIKDLKSSRFGSILVGPWCVDRLRGKGMAHATARAAAKTFTKIKQPVSNRG